MINTITFWQWILIIFTISFAFKRILVRTRGYIRNFLAILFFAGVFIHELSHLIFCVLFRVPTDGIHVHFRDERGFANPGGKVELDPRGGESMMQMFMVGFAPLFISTFLFMGCLDIIFTFESDFVMVIIAGFLALSILLTAAPSSVDITNIFGAAALNGRLTLVQVASAGLAIFMTLFYIDISFLNFPIELFYHLSSFGIMILLYFGFIIMYRTIRMLFRNSHFYERGENSREGRIQHRPRKPPKELEGRW